MNYQTRIRISAQKIVTDYLTKGIDYIDQTSKHGPVPLDINEVKLAAQWLQSDKTFADWAFCYTMDISNKARVAI